MSSVYLHKNGIEVYPAMLGAIDGARSSVALEMYIFSDDGVGREFRSRLEAASRRGIDVMVLVDAFGSLSLADSFWDGLRQAGGQVRWFRPLRRGRLPFRDHRKLLLVDDSVAFIGGLNIGDEYLHGKDGEGPWRDNALEIAGGEVPRLRRSFIRMWNRAESPLRFRFRLLRKDHRTYLTGAGGYDSVRFLESGPEDPMQPVRRVFRRVIGRANRGIDLAMGYFFPPGRVLRALKRAVRRGVRVRLMFPAKSDIAIARWAARGLYGRLLRAGMEIWEYQPSMLHAKLAIIDDTVIAGSANLDIRSGKINYELVAAATAAAVAEEARADFREDLESSRQILLAVWQQRPLFQRIAERVSYWVLARADLFIARTGMARMR